MEKLKSVGKCVFCQETYAKRSISRHLGTHLKELPGKEKSASYHLRVEAGLYYLNLLIDGDSTLGTLDRFLRQIWLECCGHMSQFSYGSWKDKLSEKEKVRRILSPGAKLWYAYDFGSSTELDIKVLDKYPFSTPEGVKLLSRNEPLELWCEACKKEPATLICTVHWGEDDSLFCDDCGEAHEAECEDAEYAMMSVVNSPRMGACAYDGGMIDLERDGIFSPKTN